MATVLQTPRLLLRELGPDDLEALYAITGSALVMRFVGDLKPYGIEKTRAMIDAMIERYRAPGFGEYAIVHRDTGQFMGFGGYEVPPGRVHVDISYIFAEEYWGQGYATELAAALVDHGFETLGFTSLGAGFDPENHASMRVASKVGFRFDSTGLDEFGLPSVWYVIHR
jgi:[ribosomal protein S5]-alanine N-acetyltransferase